MMIADTPEAWMSELDNLYFDIAATEAGAAAPILQEIYALLVRTPKPISRLGASKACVERFRSFLEMGALDSAAVALMDPKIGYMVSRGPNGVYLASVALPGMIDGICADGATFALALVSAYLAALRC